MGPTRAEGAGLVPVAELARRVRSGCRMLIAADESVLRRLPAGDWIGGTIPTTASVGLP